MDPDVRRKYAVERSFTCLVTDLDVLFLASVSEDGTISSVETEPAAGASTPGGRAGGHVGLSTTSDDLVELIDGRLGLPLAWATGRLKVDASLLDLLKLRSLL